MTKPVSERDYFTDLSVLKDPYDYFAGMAALSIWMGALLAERLNLLIESHPKKYGSLVDTAETPEFTGHIIWALYNDPSLMSLSGQTVIGAEMAVKYGIKDGRPPAALLSRDPRRRTASAVSQHHTVR